MSNRSICKGCHRLRPVNNARYCASCDAGRRAEEKRRPAAPAVPEVAAAAPTVPITLTELPPTEPAPPTLPEVTEPPQPAVAGTPFQAPGILPFVLPEIEEPQETP